MSKRAIIVVDIQNEYFPSGKLPLNNIEQTAANAAKVIEHGRQMGDLIVHVRHENPNPEAPYFAVGTDGANINEAVEPMANEIVVVKRRPNSFHETNLRQVLEEHGVECVIVIGAMSHMCIDATTRTAVDFGYSAVVVADACTTRDLAFNGIKVPAEQVHATLMAAFEFAYAQVVSTENWLSA